MLRWLRQSLRQVSSLMARRPVLVCGAILLSVLLLLAVTFTCSRAKNVVASARPPVRFFSAEAPVVDLYLGQLEQVERLRGAAEVSVIFFYAPWCAHSIAARHEVQEVARRLVKQVQFVAVNCWWSQGKCRKQKSFYQYPVIHLFYKRFGPIEYKGPFLASYVERFILRVITPLTYLPSRATLQDFLSYHEPGVVGYFQFNSSPQPPGYITYLSSALQALKRDFRGAVRFGVVTSRQVAESISVRDDQTVYLHRHFNSSLIFPSWERNFTSEGICSWVFEHRETVLQWLAPTGAKSRLLEQELTKGPALLLFLPHNPLGPGPDPLLTQIADVAVRYHSCSDSPHHHHHHPSDHYYYSGPSQPLSPPLCCLSVVLPRPHPLPGSTSRVCELCLNQSNPGRSPLCTFPSQTSGGAAVLQSYLRQCCLPVAATGRTVACSNILSSYSPSSGRYSACCRTLGQLGVSLPPQQVLGLDNEGLGTPPPSPSYSQDSSQDDSQDSSQDSSPSSQDQEAGGIKGLRCRTNKTLRFYILDSALHWPLAVRLGALGNNEMGSGGLGELGRLLGNGTGDGAQSFATIVNLKDEVHYVLDHRGTATVTESLELFIRNFSTSHSPLQRRLVGRREEEERPQKRPLISELTTTSFLTTVMDPHRGERGAQRPAVGVHGGSLPLCPPLPQTQETPVRQVPGGHAHHSPHPITLHPEALRLRPPANESRRIRPSPSRSPQGGVPRSTRRSPDITSCTPAPLQPTGPAVARQPAVILPRRGPGDPQCTAAVPEWRAAAREAEPSGAAQGEESSVRGGGQETTGTSGRIREPSH
ncbi:thioredoxin domain-containing protein 11 isoform X7 [Oncorhynchus mykiss]|uniref:thioredoxin domain-containing protein 11-like isoform X9 n=1 Tax=Oncorhynchus mykiss TaxID=8022 RepID=UPI00187858D4|nr:thioredoxin domain-containing protein 11-like isoform X9 [Oncorhynchus mykiss]XP_036829200.1 thioredoxin domain-containing protein 11 isoform X7 [Oncorhynchus mykiss]